MTSLSTKTILLLSALAAACAADSGAVPKPLVFESSAKRAAVTSSGKPAGAAGVGATAQGMQATTTSNTASAGTTARAPQANANANANAELMRSAAAGPMAGSAAPAATGPGMAAITPTQMNAGAAAMRPAVTGMQVASAPSAAGAAAPKTEGPVAGGATPCTMTVSYTAVSMRGMWYPHNIGAVWVEDANGKFVKTLERWAGIRAGYLSHWNEREDQHGKWPSCPFANVCTGPMVPDQMDVMTRATIFEDNAMHTAKWSCKNLDGEVVPDGKYKLFFEEMENISNTFPAGPLGMVEFDKGPTAAMLAPPDQAPFKNLKIVYEPTAP